MAKEKKPLGRRLNYGEETRTITIRVPKSRYDHYLNTFREYLKVNESIERNKIVT